MDADGELIRIPRFNDMHVHLRQGPVSHKLAQISAEYCQHFMAMPNTTPPLDSIGMVEQYVQMVCASDDPLPADPLKKALRIAVVINAQTTPEKLRKTLCHESVIAAKVYPEGVTTNSKGGVHDFSMLYDLAPVLEAADKPMCFHAEMPGYPVLEREERFLEMVLMPLREQFLRLKIVVEHVTTQRMCNWLRLNRSDTAGTVTAHHLMLTLDDVIGDRGLEPRNYCKPIAKHAADRRALITAALQEDNIFFGSDSAPHTKEKKYSDCGCAGCFTAPVAPSLLASVFVVQGRTKSWTHRTIESRLTEFTSSRAAAFYGLPKNLDTQVVLKPIRPVVTDRGYSLRLRDEEYPVFRPTIPMVYEPVYPTVAFLGKNALR